MTNPLRVPRSPDAEPSQEALCDTDPAVGLSTAEAERRLRELGPNELPEAPVPGALSRLAAQLSDVTVIALVLAACIAVGLSVLFPEPGGFLARFGDAIAIGMIVVLNAAIGFFQERRAHASVKALGSVTAHTARVRRSGSVSVVTAPSLVVGDVVLLEEGDRVPADLRLTLTRELAITEAALTGESVPVRKDSEAALGPDTPLAERSNSAFTGTLVASGRGEGLVVASGARTELGRIATLLGQVEAPETPLQRSLRRFGAWLVVGCVAVGAVVFAVGLLQGQAPVQTLLLIAVSLAVAAIPEGLPAITTIVLALGVQRMAARRALVRRLAAVETLGSAEVICSDKTGTMTMNAMTVRRVRTAGGLHDPSERLADDGTALAELVLACRFAPAARWSPGADGPVVTGDPTDGALLAFNAGFPALPAPEVVAERLFDTTRRMATLAARRSGGVVAFTHGAPEAVLARCTGVLTDGGDVAVLDDPLRRELNEAVEQWAGDGLRVLALAQRKQPGEDIEEEDLVFLGLVGLSDPPRPGVSRAVASARRAGIRTVMITGDHPRTALAVAREIGLPASEATVVRGADLEGAPAERMAELAATAVVVARATAEHKLRFVEALLRAGRSVAMTGDGVNDAPALRAATIGIAMGKAGTDVTREAADLVLADDDYSTIIAAVEEGRTIIANIRRFILFLLSVNSGLVLAVFVGAVLGWPPVLTPTQILWINLITNGLPALALGAEPLRDDPMGKPPRPSDAPLVSGRDVAIVFVQGAYMGALGLVFFALWRPAGLEVARTVAFTVLAIGPLFHALTSRSTERSLLALGPFSNAKLWWAFAAALALQAAAIYLPGVTQVFKTAPLGWRDLAWVLSACASVLAFGELEKFARGFVDARRGRAPGESLE